MNKEFIIDRVRKSARKENQIVAHIYASEKALESYDMVVQINSGKKVSRLRSECMVGGIVSFARIEMSDMDMDRNLAVMIDIPDTMTALDVVTIWAVNKNRDDVNSKGKRSSLLLWRGTGRKIYKILDRLNTNVNSAMVVDGQLLIKGWCVHHEELDIELYAGDRLAKLTKISMVSRPDIALQFPEYEGDDCVGFVVNMPLPKETVRLRICELADEDEAVLSTIQRIHWIDGEIPVTTKVKLQKSLHKLQRYHSNMGLEATAKSLKDKLHNKLKPRDMSYDSWAKNRLRERYSRAQAEMNKSATAKEQLCAGYTLIHRPGISITRDAYVQYNRMIEAGLKAGEPYEIIYSDNDQLIKNNKAKTYVNPSFKPDYNIDLLRSYNYIGEAFVVSEKFLKECGYLSQGLSVNDIHRLLLMAYEKQAKVGHVQEVLYHVPAGDGGENPSKEVKGSSNSGYDVALGKKNLESHYEAMGIRADVEIIHTKDMPNAMDTGYYQTTYQLQGKPKVSIVIPNKDHKSELEKCIKSIQTVNTYDNYEIIVVENNSVEEGTFQYYRELEARTPQVKILRWDREFNYSAINNYGVDNATGDYLLLLNNDIEIINPNTIESMLGMCQRQDVAAVGGRLYYEDNTIQHMGVIVGFGGVAAHAFTGMAEAEIHEARSYTACDYSAVTAACLMVRREDYLKVGGFDENCAVAFNDVDFCLKLRQLDKLIVYNPEAKLYHYESKSRGIEDTLKKQERFMGEIDWFVGKWPDIVRNGDPYYNKNLTMKTTGYQVRY